MVKLGNKEYSGQVMRHDSDVLAVVVYTVESFKDVSDIVQETRQVTDYSNHEETVYAVNHAISGKIIADNSYYFEFSTKQPLIKQLEDKILEQSNTIDDLIIAMLRE